jgi:hypothetical protein
MVDAEENPVLVEIGSQRRYVHAAPLQLHVIPLSNAIHAHVDLRLTRSDAGYFFTQEEIGIPSKMVRGINGIMIGDRDQVHAAPL